VQDSEILVDNIAARAQAPAIHRLLDVWTRFRDGYGYVPFAPFDPEALGPLADDMIVVRSCDTENGTYLHYGSAVACAAGADMTGKPMGEGSSAAARMFRETQLKALAEKRPILTIHRSAPPRDEAWERLLLPCRQTDGTELVVVFCKRRAGPGGLVGALLDASLNGILAVRLVRDGAGEAVDGEVIVANRRAAYFAGRPLEEMTGARVLTLFPHLVPSGLWQRYVEAVATREPLEFVTPFAIESGERWFEVSIVPLDDGFVATYADITRRKADEDAAKRREKEIAAANKVLQQEIKRRQELEAELNRLATIDPLTGVRNRRAIAEGLQNALALSERYGHPVSVFAVDLDHFKQINDTYGHAAGDVALKSAATILTHGLREDVDLVGRLGGEEFIAILPHTGLEAAALVAERIRNLLATTQVQHRRDWIGCTGSFGVACWDGREHPDRLLSRADDALYRAKAAGRNLVAVDEGSTGTMVMHASGIAEPPETSDLPQVKHTRRRTPPRKKVDPNQS
jgi:diguanylate cyclase (GGDEF)-like protein